MLTLNEIQNTLAYQNALLNIREMQAKKISLESYPFKVFVEATQQCDLDCIICSKSRHKSRQEMSWELFLSIEKELFDHASEVDFFVGGESTLARDFHRMIRTSSKYAFLPVIFTNAANLKEETIRLLVELGFFVNISLEAVEKGLYEKIRRGSKFENLLANIEKFLAYREKINNPRFHLRLACTCAPFNIEQAPRVVEFAKARGIRDVFFNNCDRNVFERKFYLSRVAAKARDILQEAKRIADSAKIRFSCQKKIGELEVKEPHNWEDFNLPVDKYAPRFLEKYNPYKGSCPYPWIQTLIRTDGTVMSCCQGYLKMGKYAGGDFKKIWNNARYRKLRSRKSYYHCGMTLGRWNCNLSGSSIWGS